MEITTEQAKLLLDTEKEIFVNDSAQSSITIEQIFPMSMRYDVLSTNGEFSFLWEIIQSAKNVIRISLHFQDNDSKIGLLRVDYNSGHKNPELQLPSLPQMFVPYIGKWFEDTESHVHYYVEGYKSLAWAIPIEQSDIPIKKIGEDNYSEMLAKTIKDFASLINIKTKITINQILL